MCGIAGILGPAASEPLVRRMTAAQVHRGPDDEGLLLLEGRSPESRLALGHRRLSILDLSSAGHQPMHDPESGLWIVYNGEVYNHLDLRKELGGTYRSTCDTETLLRAFARWGPDAVHRFRGMFAFAIWDAAKEELFLCRDRVGVKPLYYAEAGDSFVFASELRAVLASDLVARRLDSAGMNGFLAFGALQEPATIVRGISLLPAGHWMRIVPKKGIAEIRRYWSPPFVEKTNGSPEECEHRIGQLVTEAVECRLLSDVPLGVFLSGGIDSSAIVASMAQNGHRDIRTFTLDFKEPGYQEGPFAERIAEIYGTRHVTQPVTASDLLGRFDEALEAADQPSVDGINTYAVCRLARQAGLTVALCGHGGDELFGGYDNFHLIPRVLKFRAVPRPVRSLMGQALRYCAPVRVATRKAASLLRSRVSIYETYALARSIFWDEIREKLLDRAGDNIAAGDIVRNAIPPDDLAEHPVNQVSQLELCLYLRNTLIRDADVFSMANSLEVRVPLLDHKLIEYVVPLAGKLKTGGKAPKRLLVRSLKDALPPEIHLRRKQGFVIPYEKWIRGALSDRFERVLKNADLAGSLGLKPAWVGRIWEQFLQGNRGINMQHPLALYVLMRWCERNQVHL